MSVRCYLVTYDISSPKRWRQVFKEMKGFGEHVQLSVFRCDLTDRQHVMLRNKMEELLHHQEDQLLIVDLGKSTEKVIAGIEVVGRPRRFRRPSSRVV